MTRRHLALYLIGIALSVAQFVMIRDFVSILYGEEVVIVLVTASFFLGLSVGYLLALRLSETVFRWLFVAAVFIHLTFPFSYRFIGAWLAGLDLDTPWSGIAFLTLLFGYALVFNTVFATFLPRLVSLPAEDGTTEQQRLRTYYGLELAGFMTGFVMIALSWNHTMGRLLVPYWLVLAAILYLTLGSRLLTGLFVAGVAAATVALPQLDAASTAALYENKHGKRGAKVLYSVNSPYQKVEVIAASRNRLYLYLDGLQNLNTSDLESLNYYIADVPARLVRPANALLIGNGTMSSVPKVYPHAGAVTSVELDGGVLEAGRRFFTPPEDLAGLDRWRLVVDDGKHYLRKTRETFDLVIVDVPSPLTIQEAYLHSREFYALIAERLTPAGVVAVQLSGPLQKNDRTPARVTAALRAVYRDVMVIHSERAERGFAYASNQLPFDADTLRAATKDYETSGLDVIAPDEVDDFLTNAVPLSVNSMDIVLRRGLERFVNRYFD